MPSSVKIRAVLLWGVCVLFPVKSVTSSAPENSGMNITVPPDITTNQRITAYTSTLQPATLHPAKPADAAAHATEAASPTVDHQNGDRNTSKSESRQLGLTTAEEAVNHSKPLAPTEKVTTKDVVSVKTTTATAQTFPAGPPSSTSEPLSVSQTITARREETSAAVTTASGGVKSSTAVFTATSEEQISSSKTTGHAHNVTDVTSTGSGLHPSTAMTTATSEVQPLYSSTTAEAVNQTTDHLLQTSASSFTNTTPPATHSATTSASFVSTRNSTTITGFRSEVPSTTSLDNSTQSTSTSRGPTTSVPTTGTIKSTSTELSSKSSSVSATTNFNSTSPEPVSTSTDYSNTTSNSTSPAGAFIPHVIGSTTSSAPSTTKAPCEPSKDSSSSEVLPCSTRGVKQQCLIVIAVLALVATIFVISTIVLCIKLSARKYKVRKPQQDTEMMCISSLLPDRSHNYIRQRNPVSNGVLVFPTGGDSDEEGGDNLTLSSFLPENDRYV
ncbi:P-selectin glycoprotein ligand 1 [Gambusia affinis]|uniref:P-selectin glycoprotein ligand 1 n=1 Tax=Gambusia affinis TaxID=33528 RepID=UPI001CDD7AE5|nr:P-selectin glycoprotein ligand 1 [Gambusia affinis]XP_044000564.1 P-selectin glycoprotein ligand 1 [Gambusia affinis]